MSRTLVTGAAGFIGRHVVRALLAEADEVHGLVRDAARARPVLPDGVSLHETTPRERFDRVIDLAAIGVLPGDRAGVDLTAANVDRVVSLLDGLASGVPVLHVGSCSEYGPIPAPTRIDEDAALVPTSAYGRAKLATSRAAVARAREQGRPLAVVRPFGVYGPGEAPGRLIPWVVGKLRAGDPADLTPGEQIRDFTHVEDVARALVLASRPGVLADGTSHNVCTGIPCSVRELAVAVAEALGAPTGLLRFGRLPHRADEPMWIVGDPARFRARTGWRPEISLEAGIRATITAIRER